MQKCIFPRNRILLLLGISEPDFLLHSAVTVDRRCFQSLLVPSLMLSGKKLHKEPVYAKKAVCGLTSLIIFDRLFVATLTQPSLCPLTPWVTGIILPALSDQHCSANSANSNSCNVCHYSVPQPPPRMPTVYAEQHESDEEKQFRRVFQQLAGDVSAMSTCTSLSISVAFFVF